MKEKEKVTIGDVMDKYQHSVLFRGEKDIYDYRKEIIAIYEKIGSTITKEMNINVKAAMKLPRETELGPKAKISYQKFVNYLLELSTKKKKK